MSASDEWQQWGLCREIGPELFFDDDDGTQDRPPKGSGIQSRFAAAKKVCDNCPVWQQCRLAGMGENHGVWGGLAPRQRRAVRATQMKELNRRYWGVQFADGEGVTHLLRRMITRAWDEAGTVEAALEELPLLDHPTFYDRTKVPASWL